MSGVQCPKCGTMNPVGRFSCAKCYAPLATPTDQARAEQARRERRRRERRPGVALWPSRQDLNTVSPYDLVALAGALVVAVLILVHGLPLRLLVYFAAGAVSAAGLAAVVRHGGLDFSLGALMALGALIGVTLADYGAGPAVLAALLVGGALGWVNGLLIRLKDLPSALSTSGTAAVVAALMLAYIPDLKLVQDLGGYEGLATARFAGLPAPVWVLGIVLLVDQYLFRRLEGLKREGGGREDHQPAVAAHLTAGAHATLAGTLLGAANVQPGQLLTSAWHLLPFAALCVGGALFRRGRAPLTAAVAGAVFVAVPIWHVADSGLPVLTFLVAGVALVAGSVLDVWKEPSGSKLRARLRGDAASAFGMIVVAALVVGGGWGVVTDALHRVPPQTAMLLKSVGKVTVMGAGSATWTAAKPRQLLRRGARLRTGAESAALIMTAKGSRIKIDPGADVAFETIDTMQGEVRATHLRLSAGRVWSLVKHAANEKTKFDIETPTTVAAVRGTAFSLVAGRRRDYISCADGFVEVRAEGRTVILRTGTETEVEPNQPPAPPRAMSTAERNGWARERPLLERPLQSKLWDYSHRRGNALADTFAGAAIDPVLWRIRADDDGPPVTLRNGHVQLQGEVKRALTPTFSYGLITQSFTNRTCEAAVDVQIREGVGAGVLRLADERGSQEGVAIVIHPTKGISLQGPEGRKAGVGMAAQGYQSDYLHLVLRYEPGIRTVTGFCNGTPLGSLEQKLGNSLHYELLVEGRRRTRPQRVAVWFDNFSTDVALPPEESLRMTVAALGSPNKPAEQASLLVLQPLLQPHALTGVSVTHPQRRYIPKTRLFAQGAERDKMHFDKRIQAWVVHTTGTRPADGDYIFQFGIRGTAQHATKWMHLRETERPPSLPPLVERLTPTVLEIRWDPPQAAGADWVEVYDLKGKRSRWYVEQANSPTPNALSIPRGDLAGWHTVLAVVFARLGPTPAALPVGEWSAACASLRPYLRPGMDAWLTTSSPHGTDEFILRCGRTWKL